MSIDELLKCPERLNIDSLEFLRKIVDKYPYFQTVRLLYLKNLCLLQATSFKSVLYESVIYITDRMLLYRLLEKNHPPVYSEKYDDSHNQRGNRSMDLIDTFLTKMPEYKQAILGQSDRNMDYISFLLKDEEKKPASVETATESGEKRLRGQDLIDQFVKSSEQETAIPVSATTNGKDELSYVEEEERKKMVIDSGLGLDEEYFTETLANIYIKQHKYSKALEIIKKLSLKYPKKSTYFATQIKTLEELIINSKS